MTRHLIQLITFYIVNVLICFLIKILCLEPYEHLNDKFEIWVYSLLCVLIGQSFGYIAVINEKPILKWKTYLNWQIIFSIGLIAITTYFSFSNWLHEAKYGNIENNESFVSKCTTPNSPTRIAIDSLSTKFSNPNLFRITMLSEQDVDTNINGRILSYSIVQISYLEKNTNRLCKANYKVADNIAYTTNNYPHLSDIDIRVLKKIKKRIDTLSRRFYDSTGIDIRNNAY